MMRITMMIMEKKIILLYEIVIHNNIDIMKLIIDYVQKHQYFINPAWERKYNGTFFDGLEKFSFDGVILKKKD